MSARLREIAKRTEEIVARGRYEGPDGRPVDLAPLIAGALAGTALYGPEPVPVTPDTGRTTRFEVTGESSLEAAHRLVTTSTAPPAAAPPAPAEPLPAALPDPGPVAVLNFSSARNPGGGYLNGAQAQEEALCRASALYATLLRVPEFYAHHRTHRSPFYTDRVIHSPAVPVFRDDRGRLLNSPYTVGFLTSPAPNAGVIARQLPEEAGRVPAALASRAERVLETAVACGYRRLVLGAWGCGVFRNDPRHVAAAFRDLLTGQGRFAGHFDEVVFAVLDRTAGAATLGAFRDTFAPVAAR
ncbi:TIGR02452 family protein [Streptomyces sp. NPDC015131]|uniref:TIGR02452 family protein n=1 Tax=Streptomyces sp. NPDC015131 TaxID=3364941 RepID=UPI0036F9E568